MNLEIYVDHEGPYILYTAFAPSMLYTLPERGVKLQITEP